MEEEQHSGAVVSTILTVTAHLCKKKKKKERATLSYLLSSLNTTMEMFPSHLFGFQVYRFLQREQLLSVTTWTVEHLWHWFVAPLSCYNQPSTPCRLNHHDWQNVGGFKTINTPAKWGNCALVEYKRASYTVSTLHFTFSVNNSHLSVISVHWSQRVLMLAWDPLRMSLVIPGSHRLCEMCTCTLTHYPQ